MQVRNELEIVLLMLFNSVKKHLQLRFDLIIIGVKIDLGKNVTKVHQDLLVFRGSELLQHHLRKL
jgi:hypothetical protein